MKNIPVNHHYIPRFILRNFCTKGDNLCYFDIKRKQSCMREISNVFVVPNLYTDINNDNPTQIEEDLSKFENEASVILKKFISAKNEVVITIEENDKLMLFLAIMGFRSINAKKAISKEDNKNFYSFWQEDGRITDFWRRNLGYLANCRSIKEVIDNPNIDVPIKIFMMRDTLGIFGLYFIIAERRGGEDFILSDAYPAMIYGAAPNGFEMMMYSFFPLSPSRLLIVAGNGVKGTHPDIKIFDDCLLTKPVISRDKTKISIRIRKIYEDHVKYVNGEMMKCCKEGFAFNDIRRISIDLDNN